MQKTESSVQESRLSKRPVLSYVLNNSEKCFLEINLRLLCLLSGILYTKFVSEILLYTERTIWREFHIFVFCIMAGVD